MKKKLGTARKSAFGIAFVSVIALTLGLGALAQQDATPATVTQNVDSLFIVSASMSDAFEVESSKLALEHSSNADVKAFAQMMITDHTNAQQSVYKLPNAMQSINLNTNAAAASTTPATSVSTPANTSNTTAAATTAPATNTPATDTTTTTTPATTTPATTTPATDTTTGNSTTNSGTTGSSATNSGTAASTTTGANTSTNSSTATDASTPATTPNAQTDMALAGMLGPVDQLKILALSKLQGTAFDRAYITEQLAAHEAAIRLFRFAATNATSPEVKAFATQTLPTLRKHFNEAISLLKDSR